MDAIYTRQSIDKKDSISIETQVKICSSESSESKKSIKVYSDKGFSGKNTDRPQFKLLMQDIQSGKIKKVIVYRLDRISRNLMDFASIMEIFEKYDVEFVSCTEKFDTSTPIGKAMLSIVMVFAQLERETIQQRIKDNYRARAEEGMYLGGPPPYGFDKKPTSHNGKKTSILTANKQMPVVEEMFQKYAYGDYSLGGIVKWLNSENIPAPKGGKWESTKIQRILRNPVYVKCDFDIYGYYQSKGCKVTNIPDDFDGTHGAYLFGKRDKSAGKYTDITEYTFCLALHEGQISSETFLRCQYKLDSNRQIKNSGKGQYSWLSGIIKCGKCGYAMTVSVSNTHKYLVCRGKTSYNACPGNETIRLENVEPFVYSAMIKRINKFDLSTSSVTKDSSMKLKSKIESIDNQIANLINQVACSNDIVIEYINDKISVLHREKQELLNTMTKDSLIDTVDFNVLKDDLFNWDSLSLDKKKAAARSMISKVLVSDKKIKIEWI